MAWADTCVATSTYATTNDNTLYASHTITLSQAAAAGNTLLVLFQTGSAASRGEGLTTGTLADYTTLYSHTSSTRNWRTWLLRRTVPGGGLSSLTFDTTSNGHAQIVVFEMNATFGSLLQTSSLTYHAWNAASANPVPTLTTAVATTMLLALGRQGNAGGRVAEVPQASGWASGYVERADVGSYCAAGSGWQNDTDNAMHVATLFPTSTGTYSTTWDCTNPSYPASIQFSFEILAGSTDATVTVPLGAAQSAGVSPVVTASAAVAAVVAQASASALAAAATASGLVAVPPGAASVAGLTPLVTASASLAQTPAGTAHGSGIAPTVAAETALSGGGLAGATASGTRPTVTASALLTVPVGGATAGGTTPGVSGGVGSVDATVTAPLGGASSAGRGPALSASSVFTVPLAPSAAGGFAAVVTGGVGTVGATVTAPVAVSYAASIAPTVQATAVIQVPVGVAAAGAIPPSVAGGGTPGSSLTPAPPQRTLIVPAEYRVTALTAETRTLALPIEHRTLTLEES